MSEHLLTRALRGEVVERVPVWAMRQAGRWDPEFLRVRGATDFYTFANDTERATEATLLPERFGGGRDHPVLRHHHFAGGNGATV